MAPQIKLGSIFSGIGGFERGLEMSIPGLETIWQVEKDKYCQRVLQKHWSNAKMYSDVRTVGKHNLEPVDILCAGFPCQGFSVSGKGKGLDDERSGLYWELWRVISEIRPGVIALENVPAIINRGLSEVLISLAKIGYDAEWSVISAAQFGAPHKRARWFCVAYSNQDRVRETDEICSGGAPFAICDRKENSSYSNYRRAEVQIKRRQPSLKVFRSTCKDRTARPYWEKFPTQSPLCRRNDGISNRVDRIRALGNAIVPQCSEWIGKQILNSGLLNKE